jgi:hypothetical protein
MTIEELNQIEDDLRKIEAIFPNDYSTMKAFELIAELRRLITHAEAQPGAA